MTVATTAAPTASMIPIVAPTTPTTAPRVASRGTLNFAISQGFPSRPDALRYANVTFYGMSELLSRLTPEGKIAPWLAERVANVDPTTWRVTLRAGVTFWDGTPLTPDVVIAAFRRVWDTFPDANGLINRETRMTALDARTVEFVTPQPNGSFPNVLTLPLFSIHKPGPMGGMDGSILTGPYRPTAFVVDERLELEPFAGYWGGTPPVGKIIVRRVVDANARVLALQSGEVNALYNPPPEAIPNLGDADITTIPSGRVHILVYNVNRPPFDDRAVREAASIALDRAALNTLALEGKGTAPTGMFPPNIGYDVVPMATTDLNRARRLLDEAGWVVGSDGVRVKAGTRLSFPLLAFNGRPELPALAVGIQAQLKQAGFEITQIQPVAQNILTEMTKGTNWAAAVFSNDTFPTGDPLYCYNRLIARSGGNNLANYSNPRIETLLNQYRAEVVAAKQQSLSRQIQEIVKEDQPIAFISIPPVTFAARKGTVRGYMPHPSDAFFVTSSLMAT